MSVLEQLPEAELIELCAAAVALGKFSLSLDCRSCRNDWPDTMTLVELVPYTEFIELSGPDRSCDTSLARFLNNVLTILEVNIFWNKISSLSFTFSTFIITHIMWKHTFFPCPKVQLHAGVSPISTSLMFPLSFSSNTFCVSDTSWTSSSVSLALLASFSDCSNCLLLVVRLRYFGFIFLDGCNSSSSELCISSGSAVILTWAVVALARWEEFLSTNTSAW